MVRLALVLFAVGAAGTATSAPEPAPTVDTKALEAQRRELKARVEALQRELSASESMRADAADALKATAVAISDANRRLHELDRERGDSEATILRLDAEHASLAQQVAGEQELLARLLVQQQMGGRQEPLKLLLSGRDPGEISRLLHYLRAIGDLRAKEIADLRGHQQQLQALSREAQAQRERLAALARDEAALRADLQQQRDVHAQVLARVAGEVRRQQRELDRLKRDDARLSRLLDRLARIARTHVPAPAGRSPPKDAKPTTAEGPPAVTDDGAMESRRGTLPMPVRGELAGRFGTPRGDGAMTWKGWFIRCPVGREVAAIAAGRVVYADWLRGFGNLLIVDHGGGYMSLYGNNDALLASVGAMVGEGEAVAQAGSSGGGTESGVYFEIRHQGTAVDPATWIGR